MPGYNRANPEVKGTGLCAVSYTQGRPTVGYTNSPGEAPSDAPLRRVRERVPRVVFTGQGLKLDLVAVTPLGAPRTGQRFNPCAEGKLLPFVWTCAAIGPWTYLGLF